MTGDYARRAQLSINIIIVAVLVLVVIAILIYLVIAKTGDWRAEAESCELIGGECSTSCAWDWAELDATCSNGGVCCGQGIS